MLLVSIVLLVAAQAFAGNVTMSVTKKTGTGAERWATIGYSSDVNVSGFGLKITADSGATFTAITDYNIGESNSVKKGYGIFPGGIVIDSNGVVTDYNTPIAPPWDPCAAGTGLGTNTIIAELGALYQEGNQPGLSGTLLSVKVDADCNVCVTGEPVRGNVVVYEANGAIVSVAPATVCASIISQVVRTLTVASLNPNAGVTITVVPNDNDGNGNGVTQFTRLYNDSTVVTLTAPAVSPTGTAFKEWRKGGVFYAGTLATNVTVDADFTMTAVYDTVRRLTVTGRNPDASAGAISITVSPNDRSGNGNGVTQFTRDYNDGTVVSLTAPNFVTIGVTNYNFKQWNKDSVYQTTNAATTVTMDANHTMRAEYDCFPSADPNYGQWTSVGKPCCWCYPRQCKGDADGTPFTKANYWVSTPDLTILTKAWQKTIAQLQPVVEPNICADFDHLPFTKANYRVSTPDLTILSNISNWQVNNGPPIGCVPGNRTPATCP